MYLLYLSCTVEYTTLVSLGIGILY